MEQGQSNVGMVVLAIMVTAIVVGGGVYYWQQNTSANASQTTKNNVQPTDKRVQLETKRGVLGAHPENTEAAYLQMDDGTTLFLIDQSGKEIFPPFIGKKVEVKGTMSYPPNPAARDQAEFDVSEVFAL